jgi:hypothetical protein
MSGDWRLVGQAGGGWRKAMMHRHITTTKWTMMAIESLFDRGTLADWREFAAELEGNEELAEKVRKVCGYRAADGAERIAGAILSEKFRAGIDAVAPTNEGMEAEGDSKLAR